VSYRDRTANSGISIGALLEPRPQTLQESVHRYLEAAKRWNDQMALHQRSFAEYYCEGSAALIYQLELAVFSSNPDGSFSTEIPFRDSVLSAFAVFHKHMLDFAHVKMGDKQLVLVKVVEPIEGIESVSVPSLIGLYLVKDQGANADEERLVWSSSEKLFKQSPVGIDWELFLPSGRYRLPANFSPRVVDGRSQVVQSVAKNQADVNGNSFDNFDFNEVIERVSITVNKNSVDATFTENLKVRVKVIDLLLGPFEL
jgi:hypothetical protein